MYRKQVTSGVTGVASELTKYDESRKFKYDDLKGKGNCPTGVDATKKEVINPCLYSCMRLPLIANIHRVIPFCRRT